MNSSRMVVFEITLLGCYAALIGSQLPMFRDSLSVVNHQTMLRNVPEDRTHRGGSFKSYMIMFPSISFEFLTYETSTLNTHYAYVCYKKSETLSGSCLILNVI